jgi:hypothetical protein
MIKPTPLPDTHNPNPTIHSIQPNHQQVFQAPAIYTFRAKNDFVEDSLFRHIEPSHAFHLDLVRPRRVSLPAFCFLACCWAPCVCVCVCRASPRLV